MALPLTRGHRPIPILTYHQLDVPPARGTPFRSLTVSPPVFARHMRMLALLGWRGLSMRDLMPYLRGERQGRVFGLTFDDGFVNVLRHAVPVLDRVGFTATNYIVAGHPGGRNFWDARHGVPQTPLMDSAMLRDWVAAGHEVGSHTLDHVDLPACEADEARRQITASRSVLQAMTGEAVEAFCYPYGFFREEHAAMACEAGYASATTTRRGRVAPGAGLFTLPRVPVVRSTAWPALLQKLYGGYEDKRGARDAARAAAG